MWSFYSSILEFFTEGQNLHVFKYKLKKLIFQLLMNNH